MFHTLFAIMDFFGLRHWPDVGYKAILRIYEEIFTPTFVRKSIRLFLVIFLLTGTVISGVMMVFYRSVTTNELDLSKKNERFVIGLQYKVISDNLSGIVGDLLFLSQQNELHEYLSSGDQSLLDKIGDEYISLSKQKYIYDQIRFLDSTGMEIIRVNNNHGAPSLVPANELQSKQKRYYFEDCFKMGKGEIFISPFDLNIEHGKIEQPFKPMIRMGTPVFDKTGGKQGILLVNYYGKKLLDKIIDFESLSEGETMLLNADGYWLLSPQPELEWGFMFQDAQRTLAVADLTAWKKIRNQDQGQIETLKGVYTFRTVYPAQMEGYQLSMGPRQARGQRVGEIGHDAYCWHLVSFLSAEKIAATNKSFLLKFLSIGAGLLLCIAIGAWMIAFAVTKRKIYQAQLQAMALFDPLTQLPNRTLFFDRLKMTAEHSRRYDSQFALLYIDLDGFKEVNDTFGHDAGDELLKIVGDIFLNICRKSDTVARMGGDEFAIIYAELDSISALEAFATRIIDTLKSPVELAAGSVAIGASIGIALFPTDSDNLENLISLADKAMYVSKHRGKNTCTLANSVSQSEGKGE
jgi:diguanylate cyclase (GGDEF)-like protein